MAATIETISSSYSIKTNDGTLDSGRTKVKSYTFSGASLSGTATKILAFSNAVGALITNPVLEVLRKDENLVSDDA